MKNSKYEIPSIEVVTLEVKDHILSTSGNILNDKNIVEDDPSYGWGSLH